MKQSTARALSSVLSGAALLSLAALQTQCNNTPSVPACPSACGMCLQPSGSNDTMRVQEAFISAPSGSSVCFAAGTYNFDNELSIAQPGITVRGADQANPPVFDFAQQRSSADAGTGGRSRNSMLVTANNFTVQDLVLKNAPGDGIRVNSVTGVTFRRVRATWDTAASASNGAYALYPVGCTNVLVEYCDVSNAADAGIYVGQSHNIIVRNNEVHGNVAGIEIENSTDADVYNNHTFDNTAGILVFNLPNLPVRDGRRALVRDNQIEHNNGRNFAAPGAIVANVPVGLGVMVMSNDQVEVRGNNIQGNNTTGVLVVDYTIGVGATNDTMFNRFPEGIWIHDNMFAGNGTHGDRQLAMYIPGDTIEDIVWDGSHDNARAMDPTARVCVTGNGAATYRNINFPSVGSPITDVSTANCMQPALPTITMFQ